MRLAENLRPLFQRYLRLEAPLDELRASLGPSWRFEREGENYHLSGDLILDQAVPFDIEDVRFAIGQALQRGVDLQDWANLLIMSDSYEPAAKLSESELDRLLGVLHELASPSIHDGSDRKALLRLHDRLNE
jgi:hypothetical protein